MFRWFLASIAAAVTVATASADFTITSVPSIGPLANSPSFAGYANNAVASLQGGMMAPVGNPNLPTYYSSVANTVTPGFGVNFVSGGPPLSSNSPNGGVNDLFGGIPNQGGVFANEVGNALYFGISVVPNVVVPGQNFTANDVNFAANSNVSGPFTLNIGMDASFNQTYLLGRDFTSGVLGPVTGPTQTLTELYYVGFGYSAENTPGLVFDPATFTFSTPAELVGFFNDPFTPAGPFTGTYSIAGSAPGVGVTDVNGVPAPATLGLLGVGLAGLVARVRRRRLAA